MLNVRWLGFLLRPLFSLQHCFQPCQKFFWPSDCTNCQGKQGLNIKFYILLSEWNESRLDIGMYIQQAVLFWFMVRVCDIFLASPTIQGNKLTVDTTRTLNWERSRYGESARYFPRGGEMFVIIDTYLHPFVTFENHK